MEMERGKREREPLLAAKPKGTAVAEAYQDCLFQVHVLKRALVRVIEWSKRALKHTLEMSNEHVGRCN